MVVKKNCFCVFSILMFGKEAVYPDGLFVPAVFREVPFYLNSLKLRQEDHNQFLSLERICAALEGDQVFTLSIKGGKAKEIPSCLWVEQQLRRWSRLKVHS